MSKFVIGLIAFAVGIVVGGFGALTVGGATMMGAGVGTGLTTGVCLTVQAAEDLGVMTTGQVDLVLRHAADNLGARPDGPDDGNAADTSAKCREFLAKLKR